MNDKKEFLNEEQYQKTEKKLLTISKILLIIGICLSASIIIFGIISTNKENSNINNNIEKVDYVADTNAEIERLKSELEEKKPKLTEETAKLTAKKNELIAKGVKQSSDYNKGEAYDLYILDDALDPGYNSCWNDKYAKNDLTKEYCSLRNDVEKLEEQIETKQKYISSGRAATETAEKNARLQQEASWSSSSNRVSFMKYVIMAIPAFMFPAMIAFFLFMTAKRRNIMAFTAQQTMPVAQEGIEKMSPTIGKAGKTIAKEVVKGIREAKEDQIKCKHCGELTDKDSTYCESCGKKL